MAYTRNVIVIQAKAWIGCKEADGSHKEIIDVYNAHTPLARGYKVKYTDSWCATFVSAVAIKCGYTDIIPTECSCSKMIDLFDKLGCWKEDDSYTPSAGDIIFYDWQDTTGSTSDNAGNPDHVGIVETVVDTTITVIEGNKSNAVARRTLQVNGKYIRGYGLPKYSGSTSTKTTTTASSSTTKTTTTSSNSKPTYKTGSIYKTQVDKLNVRKGAGTTYAKVTYGALTTNAKMHAYGTGQLKKGTTVTCKEVKTVGSDTWIRIPSGWIAAYFEGKVYVK